MGKKKETSPQPTQLPTSEMEWEMYKDEISELIDWTPAKRGQSEATQEDRQNYIELLCRIAKEWIIEPSADVARIMKRVDISVQTYFKYCRMNPRYADYINGIKQSRMQGILNRALEYVEKVLESPQDYEDKTVLACVQIILKHKVAREAGFAKETDIKVFNIVDKSSPIPTYTDEELENTKI